MAKRFSGEMRLTISKRQTCDNVRDSYDVKIKAPGCAAHEGVTELEAGFTQLHGEDVAIDSAARKYMAFCEQCDEFSGLVAKAAKVSDIFHVGRSKADRWPGGSSNTKTKKGR
jgi:hypothetical protein